MLSILDIVLSIVLIHPDKFLGIPDKFLGIPDTPLRVPDNFHGLQWVI